MPAPYSDNLYSALSDSEPEDVNDNPSNDDALSPTDGYFHTQNSSPSHAVDLSPTPRAQDSSPEHETPYVPNVLVEDPTLRQRTKEEEASHSPGAQAQTYNTGQGTPWNHRRGVEDDEPLRTGMSSGQASSSRPVPPQIPMDAPPAYSPRSPISPTSPQSGIGYQTFGTAPSQIPDHSHSTNAPEEHNRLLPREPESMGGDPSPGRPTISRWQAYKAEWKDAKWGSTRRKVRTVLSTLLIIAIVISLVGGLFSLGAERSRDEMKPPGSGKGPSHSPPTTRPGDLRWLPLKQCHPNKNPSHRYNSVASFDFTPEREISIYQKIDDEDHDIPSGRTPHISGNVVIKPIDDTSASPLGQAGGIALELLANDKDLTMKVEMNQVDQALVLRTPRAVEWHESGDPCIQIRVTVFVPQHAVLKSLNVEVIHLNINVLDGLNLTLKNKVLLASLSGDINTPSSYELSSREIWVETVSGDISGFYPLYDLLGIHTASGTVNTVVNPKPAADSDPKPAKLDVASVSGDLTVKEALDGDSPARDYVVGFGTSSGTIDAEVAVSSEGRFSSQSADFKLKIQPVLQEGAEMKLDTETKSGTTKLDILDPFWVKKYHLEHRNQMETDSEDSFHMVQPHLTTSTELANLRSRHSSISGTIDLRYPSSWSGQFEAETLSGSQKFRGEGLRTGTKMGMFPSVLRGRKGEGRSALRVHTVSGDQEFLVGRE